MPVIIWTRWGILSFLGFGAGVVFGVTAGPLLGVEDGVALGALICFAATLVNLALTFLVYPRVDKPTQVMVSRQLPQPYRWSDGRVQTHEVVPALDDYGNPIWETRTSTLFFIPARLLWIPLTAVTLGLTIAALLGG